MNKDHEMPLIFGRTFMATVGATIDMPNKRVCSPTSTRKFSTRLYPPNLPHHTPLASQCLM
uniref:Uncharacterized protein n=1 Tax=Brassica oleracea TaxID=3712 RepID=A0A3P6EHU7_BRAOL|nr:unnamed protein product [Brassica oleracea]